MTQIALIDTHCHLELIEETGEGEAARAVEAAVANAVVRLVSIGLGSDNELVVARARRHPEVYATVGWHPHQDRIPSDEELEAMLALSRAERVCAIGEIGLDYFWRPGYHEVAVDVQQESFRRMLSVARQAGLPAVVHNRDAHADTLEILRDYADVPVVMHAFSGDVAFAAECMKRDVTVSVAGPVTYPSAGALRQALVSVPLDRLVLETDAPFLPPQPWRGRPSRPAMVLETANKLAEVKGLSLTDLAVATSANAARIYRMPTLAMLPG
jgi:TatD DNase family protein